MGENRVVRPGAALGRTALVSAALLTTLACSAPERKPDPAEPEPSGVRVRIDPERRFQTLEGFGASIAWYANLVADRRDPELDRLLFSDLGLDILRLRNRHQRSAADDADLAADVAVVERATAALGRPPRILMTSWSPPAALKESGRERCNDDRDCTLRRRDGAFVYEEFARYWRDSLERYRELGIEPSWISIQNEPSFIPPDWEGCRFEPSETADYPGYDRALSAVRAAIAPLSSVPKLLGPETLGIHYGSVQNYLAQIDPSLVDGVAHHLYELGSDGTWDWKDPGPESFVDEMRSLARATDKPLFQTEFKTDADGLIEGGFETAWLIHSSLAEEGVAAFLYWDLVWAKDSGLVVFDEGGYTVRDQYHSLRHFARYTDAGDARIGATSTQSTVKATAFLAPDASRLTVVVLNTGAADREVTIESDAFAAEASEVFRSVYRPGSSELWSRVEALPDVNALLLPSRSVATIVLSGSLR